MTGFPEAFEERMRGLLGPEYEAFRGSLEEERLQGLRANGLKASEEGAGEEFQKRFQEKFQGFGLSPVPWAADGFYYSSAARPGKSPFHEAGAYYIQEPSAMAVVSLLDPRPGERVLDLCAAPGGKTSHAASRMGGRGLLVSNEIHPARARILSQNVERMGCRNAVVTCQDPAGLTEYFPEFFDKIIVDAPCSGEGMFRKDQEAREQWSPENVALCAGRQRQILHCAAAMLRPGGMLVYSTCTFAPEEDEGSVESFLEDHPEFQIVQGRTLPGLSSGRPEWVGGRRELAATFRIWPHLAEGEGHYLALLRKDGEAAAAAPGVRMPACEKDKGILRAAAELLEEVCPRAADLRGRREWMRFGDQLYLLPAGMSAFDGLKVLRPGLHVATVKKNRLEPAHALAAALREAEAARICRLSEAEAVRFINGEAIQTDGEKGWTLVSVEGYSLGWGKQAGGQLKNHYPKGLRRQTEPAVERADSAMQRVEPAVQGAGRPQGEWTI